jgi:hypothetical protein
MTMNRKPGRPPRRPEDPDVIRALAALERCEKEDAIKIASCRDVIARCLTASDSQLHELTRETWILIHGHVPLPSETASYPAIYPPVLSAAAIEEKLTDKMRELCPWEFAPERWAEYREREKQTLERYDAAQSAADARAQIKKFLRDDKDK